MIQLWKTKQKEPSPRTNNNNNENHVKLNKNGELQGDSVFGHLNGTEDIISWEVLPCWASFRVLLPLSTLSRFPRGVWEGALVTFTLSCYKIHRWLFVLKVSDITSSEFPGVGIYKIVPNCFFSVMEKYHTITVSRLVYKAFEVQI